ncbi:MAG: DHH family phosphoesterase, partial [Pseudomonadota bacterium]
MKPEIIARSIPETDWRRLHESPLLARLFASRGIEDPAALEMTLSQLHAPDSLSHLSVAIELLVKSLRNRQDIIIVGDYDADGATSTAFCVRMLRAMGDSSVDYFVPNRFRFGYGLSEDVVEHLSAKAPALLITVDNGIASLKGVSRAKECGFDVLITDHHLPGSTLPNADVIVNPNLNGDQFPSKYLAGVGVVFYLLSALRSRLVADGWFEELQRPVPNPAQYLDLVALGTVADVVPLDTNNRILVEQGLRRIRAKKTCLGIAALIDISGRNISNLVASDLAFAVGPRLNAAGRLDDMSLGIECLITDSPERASEIAQELDSLNRSRRDIEQQMRVEADSLLDQWLDDNAQQNLPAGVSLYDPNWHEGVIGILAGRVRESVHRPC